ncbi:hypothetical protein D3C86_2148520 [compost metagenome]
MNVVIRTKIKNAKNFRNYPAVMTAIGGTNDRMDFFAVCRSSMFKFFDQNFLVFVLLQLGTGHL